jgi:hypothetical protein
MLARHNKVWLHGASLKKQQPDLGVYPSQGFSKKKKLRSSTRSIFPSFYRGHGPPSLKDLGKGLPQVFEGEGQLSHYD